MSDLNQFVQAQKLSLSGSGCTSTASSIVLSSFYLADGTTLAAMTDFGTIGFMTIEPGTSKEENISFTGITQNADGTATLTGVSRGLGFVAPYTAVSANQKAHAGGSVVIVSNSAPFYDRMTSKNNDETIAGLWDFTTAPTVPAGATGSQALNYTQAAAIMSGAVGTADETIYGTVKTSVAPASAGVPIAVGSNDPQFVQYFAETGVADAYVITPSPAISAYAVGQRFSFKAVNANTTASTLNVNGLGAKTIKKLAGATDLVSGDIGAGQLVTVEYDGTNFQMTSPVGNAPSAIVATDVQTFTANGTWTKPTGAKIVEVFAFGAGGSGGAGGGAAGGNSGSGGSGGAGGGFSKKIINSSLLGATETVVVGVGYTGGVGSSGGSGTNGTDGGDSTFGTNKVIAKGGAKGRGGAVSGAATTGGTGGVGGGDSHQNGGNGGAGTAYNSGGSGTAGTSTSGDISPRGGAGGGGGGSAAGGNTGATGGSFTTTYIAAGGTAGANGAGGNGTDGSTTLLVGGTGGGGGGGTAGGTYNGGNGGLYGGGGGGGSGAEWGVVTTGGDGGDGKDGLIVVITYF